LPSRRDEVDVSPDALRRMGASRDYQKTKKPKNEETEDQKPSVLRPLAA
jgi:hypothetical protein